MVIVLDVGPGGFFSFFLTFQCKICRLLTYIWGEMGRGDGVGGRGLGGRVCYISLSFSFRETFRSKCTYHTCLIRVNPHIRG